MLEFWPIVAGIFLGVYAPAIVIPLALLFFAWLILHAWFSGGQHRADQKQWLNKIGYDRRDPKGNSERATAWLRAHPEDRR